MNILYGGMAVAALAGAIAGSGIKYDPNALPDRPRGPQQIYSQAQDYSYSEIYGYAPIVYREGSVPDYVVGTDWLPGGRHSLPPLEAMFDIPEPKLPTYDPAPVSLAYVSTTTYGPVEPYAPPAVAVYTGPASLPPPGEIGRAHV